MKYFLYLFTLLILASCNGKQSKSPTLQMDPDFEPTEPHPFTERIETTSGQKLLSQDLTLHGDTLGSLIIERTGSDLASDLLYAFNFRTADGNTGSVTCQYNEFNELTDLWVESPAERIHSMLQWGEDGNLGSINQEVWNLASADHTMHVIEYRYSKHSGYGNWYAGMAEQIGGCIAPLLHAGLLGRAPWTLPEAITYVQSEIQDNMIGSQQTHTCQPEYAHDHNGRVISEKGDRWAYEYHY